MMHFTHGVKGIVEETLRSGGGTWSISVNTHGRIMATANPHATGFYVGTGHADGQNWPLDAVEVARFIKDNLHSLTGLSRCLLGTWRSGDRWYLELSEHFGGRIEAVRIARERKQLALWDISNACEIRVKGNAALPLHEWLGDIYDHRAKLP